MFKKSFFSLFVSSILLICTMENVKQWLFKVPIIWSLEDKKFLRCTHFMRQKWKMASLKMNQLLSRFTKKGIGGVKMSRETYDVIYGWPLVLEWLADEAGGVVVGYELKDQPSCKKTREREHQMASHFFRLTTKWWLPSVARILLSHIPLGRPSMSCKSRIEGLFCRYL